MKHITVDFSRKTGTIGPMHGVNNGPIQPTNNTRRFGSNAEAYREAGIPYARNHDASFRVCYGGEYAHDVENIFRNFDADENDPANYDFTLTDLSCQDTADAGVETFYRLGSRIEHEVKRHHTCVPKDFGKWARIAGKIIDHLCYGWADGLHLKITYWEIWNEPDLVKPTESPCWQGTEEEFIEFYTVVARYLKQLHPELKIGGPAFTGGGRGADFVERFVRHVSENRVPLDFFSFHGYSSDPHVYSRTARYCRDLLDRYALQDTELILNEWNYVRGWRGEDMKYSYDVIPSVKGAAYVAASMLEAQKSPLDMFMYYDASPDSSFNGMFKLRTLEILKPYYAFWQFNRLYRLKTEVFSEADSENIYVGAAADGGEGAVMIAYYSDAELSEETVELHYKGVSGPVEFSCMLVDQDHDNEPLAVDLATNVVMKDGETFAASEGKMRLKLKLHSIVLVTLKPWTEE